ncbi:hypothetical protein L1987_50853 [Smallanthus sonchifolius]|uniref:Uncharacterized protein n=1 Tax=Smallanthus sonchifolius TaxID=185202 RepID=A0ACB9EPG2_9ASTR|nr:hypothetical protein L1987_50853 [Smallanthus sonchifolius]
MGLSSSKRVIGNLRCSSELNSACDGVYEPSLSLAQQVVPGIPRYKVASATDCLYQTLSDLHVPLIDKWFTPLPTRSQIDKALQKALPEDEGDVIITLGDSVFKEFAVDMYTDVIVSTPKRLLRPLLKYSHFLPSFHTHTIYKHLSFLKIDSDLQKQNVNGAGFEVR